LTLKIKKKKTEKTLETNEKKKRSDTSAKRARGGENPRKLLQGKMSHRRVGDHEVKSATDRESSLGEGLQLFMS